MIETGWVYVITNESMPGLVKVGVTKNRPEERAKELDETGSPTPYKVETAFLFSEAAEQVEKQAHALLADVRVRGNREWFKCLPWLAAEKVLDAADILNSVVLKNEPVLLSQQDLLLREEKKKREREEEEARQLLRWEEEKASEARKREEEKVKEARRLEEEKNKETRERIRREREKILAPYEKELKRLEWWENFWVTLSCGWVGIWMFLSLFFYDLPDPKYSSRSGDSDIWILHFLTIIPVGLFSYFANKIQKVRVKRHEETRPENLPTYPPGIF